MRYILFLICFLFSITSFAIPMQDSLYDKLEKQNEDTSKVNMLLRLSEKNLSNAPEKFFIYANQALDLSEKLNYKKGLADANNNLGIFYYYKEDYHKALEYYLASLKLRLQLDDKKALSGIYTNIGATYNYLANYTNALEFYLKSLKIDEEIGDKHGMARSYNNIGIIYYINGNYVKTLDYFLKSAHIKESLSDSIGLASSYISIGELFRLQKNYSRSIEFFTKSLILSIKDKNIRMQSQAYLNIGLAYKDLRNNILARENFNKAIELKQQIDDIRGLILSLINIASTFKDDGELKKAKEIYLVAQEQSIKINSLDNLKEIYNELSEIYEISKEYDNALIYHKLYSNTKDSIEKVTRAEKMLELQTQFESEQKEKEIYLLKKDNELNEYLLVRQRLVINFAIVIIALVILLTILFFRSYRIKRKSNKLLYKQTQKLLDQSSKLELANLNLEKLSLVAQKTSNAVAILDQAGNIEWLNDGFSYIYGYSFDEFISAKKSKNIIELSSNPNIEQVLNDCIKHKKSISYETETFTKKGNKIWIQTTLTPIFNEYDKLKKIIAVDTDITIIKKAEAEISIKNKNITDSINYAKRIQDSILAKDEDLKKYFNNSFVYYNPKDIVSGDFYWFYEYDQKIIIAVADCTGHGVPGALMSMIGVMLLNEIVKQKHIHKPNQILEKLNQGVMNLLHQDVEDSISQDGMDIAICLIDKGESTIEYSGAMSPIYIIDDNKVNTLEADLRSIGGSLWGRNDNLNFEFSTQIIEIKENMSLYMFTDGYLDQFGGQDNSKYNSQRFRNLIISINDLPAKKQKKIITETIKDWKGETKQLDDMLIIGVNF